MSVTVRWFPISVVIPNWLPLPGGIVSDLGNQRTVTDTTAPVSPKKYYRVEIAK